MDSFTDAEATLLSPPSLPNRYVFTQVGSQRIAVLSFLISEILLIERSQILSLPWYDPAILGVMHHHGRIIPLVALHPLLKEVGIIKEIMTVVVLSQQAAHLTGVGLVVDQVLDNRSQEQVNNQQGSIASISTSSKQEPQILTLDLLSDRLWQPQR
jgi:chemotaxis signal transduction protein